MKTYLLLLFIPFVSCNQAPCENFKADAKKYGKQFEKIHSKYFNDNKDKLTDKEFLHGMDSIARLFFIDRNLILIKKYPRCNQSVNSLNYIKREISKKQLKALLLTIPHEFKSDTNYVAIEQYLRFKL